MNEFVAQLRRYAQEELLPTAICIAGNFSTRCKWKNKSYR